MHLSADRKYTISPGIQVVDLSGPGPVAGSVCAIDLARNQLRMFVFNDLIHASFHPDHGCFTQPAVNLGATVRDFILGHRYECQGLQAYPDWLPPYRDSYRKCLVASNTLQTNFVRSNGFVVVEGQVIAKPLHAPGRDDPDCATLGVAGRYTCLLVDATEARVVSLRVLDPAGRTTDPPLAPGSCGIASPRLLSEGRFVGLAQHPAPFRDRKGRLNGDWVDWDPDATATSFTAFGVDRAGARLLMASVFEGQWGVDTATNEGVRASEMAELLLECGAHDAILGGGAADTQQFVRGRSPRFRTGPVRTKPPSMSRGEVKGVRGLGAIAGILPRARTRPVPGTGDGGRRLGKYPRSEPAWAFSDLQADDIV